MIESGHCEEDMSRYCGFSRLLENISSGFSDEKVSQAITILCEKCHNWCIFVNSRRTIVVDQID
jgi:hypothetical protein